MLWTIGIEMTVVFVDGSILDAAGKMIGLDTLGFTATNRSTDLLAVPALQFRATLQFSNNILGQKSNYSLALLAILKLNFVIHASWNLFSSTGNWYQRLLIRKSRFYQKGMCLGKLYFIIL